MKYFIKFNYHQYKKKQWFSKDIDIIEPISLGISSYDGRECWVIFNDFNLRVAWKNKKIRETLLKDFCYFGEFKDCIGRFGNGSKQIIKLLDDFITGIYTNSLYPSQCTTDIEIYGSGFDFFLLSRLFGGELPNKFPKYFINVQELKDKAIKKWDHIINEDTDSERLASFIEKRKIMESLPRYPKIDDRLKYNALCNARFNMDLYKFLNNEI